jgi:hypothetical protein
MYFAPNTKNLGGKVDIETHQKKHYLALYNAKSSLGSLKPPRQHVDYKLVIPGQPL